MLAGTNHIFGTAEARVIKFCTQVDYIISQFKDHKPTLKWRGKCHVTHFFIFDAHNYISGTIEATLAKLSMRVKYIKCYFIDIYICDFDNFNNSDDNFVAVRTQKWRYF